MPANKSHHFVPQFLLRQFAAERSGRYVHLFRIAARKHIPTASIRDQCAKDRLYGKGLVLERGLSDLEDEVAVVIHRITEQHVLPQPFSNEMAALLVFMTFQWARTPAAGVRQVAFSAAFKSQVLKSYPGPADDLPAMAKQMEMTQEDGIAFAMSVAGDSWRVLADLRLKVLQNTSPIEFVLSDAPVVLHNQWCRRITTLGTTGLACAGLQVVLPLSPDSLAILYDDDVYDCGLNDQDLVEVSDPDEVQRYNALQLASAEHALFYRSPDSARSVESLPLSAREGRLGIQSARFREDDGDAQLIQVSNIPLNVDLKRGALRTRHEAYTIPPHQRLRRLRPEAKRVVDALRPTPTPSTGKPQRFRRVND
jgi:hypothetical protein